jgi:hypothetical protein
VRAGQFRPYGKKLAFMYQMHEVLYMEYVKTQPWRFFEDWSVGNGLLRVGVGVGVGVCGTPI